MVTAAAEVMRTASRARKSSAGYDLTRRFVGAEGTLGVITEVTLRLHGIPEAISAAVLPVSQRPAACDATILAIQSGLPVARIELLDAMQVKAVNAYSKLSLAETPMLFLEFHGTAAGVEEQALRFGEIAAELGGGPFEWETQAETARACGRRGTTPTGRPWPCSPATPRCPRTCACRSPGSPTAWRRRSATSPRRTAGRRSSGMSATAISTCW